MYLEISTIFVFLHRSCCNSWIPYFEPRSSTVDGWDAAQRAELEAKAAVAFCAALGRGPRAKFFAKK